MHEQKRHTRPRVLGHIRFQSGGSLQHSTRLGITVTQTQGGDERGHPVKARPKQLPKEVTRKVTNVLPIEHNQR